MTSYVIGAGIYSNYRIIAVLDGPEGTDIRGLWAAYADEFGIDSEDNGRGEEERGVAPVWDGYCDRVAAAMRLHAAGFGAGPGNVEYPSFSGAFVEWLKSRHGFVDNAAIIRFNIYD